MYKKQYNELISHIYRNHNIKWLAQRKIMRDYANMYSLDFWKDLGKQASNMIQSSDARTFIEGYLSSLFSKAPSVTVQDDVETKKGNPAVAQSVINRFLDDQEGTITNACRLALIFPCSFFKLIYNDNENVNLLDRFTLETKRPWEIIVDDTAHHWETQRWLASIEYLTVGQASDLYGKKDWSPIDNIDFLEEKTETSAFASHYKETKNIVIPDEYKYVIIVDFYDRQASKRIVWTPSINEGVILKESDIPDHNGQPLVPVIPLYLNINPEKPLEGFSFMKSIYDPIKEKNLLRSHLASQIRRDSRQYLYREGSVDEEAIARLVTGEDMTFVPVDGDTANVLVPVPSIPIASNQQYYNSLIENDLQRSNMMASFTRGQSTNVTATEIAALQQYTASEVGKLARVRDTAIENIAASFIAFLAPMIEEEEAVTITVDGKATIVQATDLEGKLRIIAVDQGTLPITKAAKKAELIGLVPVLMQFGVPKEKILKEIISLYELPPSFADIPVAEPVPNETPIPVK